MTTSPDALFFGIWREFLNPWSAIRDYLRLTEIVVKDAADQEWKTLQDATKEMDEETRGAYLSDQAEAYELLKARFHSFTAGERL